MASPTVFECLPRHGVEGTGNKMGSITIPTTPTLPRLVAITKNFTSLQEQIHQATGIVGLPGDWDTLEDEKERSRITRSLVRARAEWVLRWILTQLKDETEAGLQARASVQAWKLLEWMLCVVSASRCATHLRDADFITILEKTLQENVAETNTAQGDPLGQELEHRKDLSESSETVQEDSGPSRKRKRSSSGTVTPSKKQSLELPSFKELFVAVSLVLKSMIVRTDLQDNEHKAVQAEHLKMVLRTESGQAARIMKFWFTAVEKLFSVHLGLRSVLIPGSSHELFSLSYVLHIWNLRIIDVDDEFGSSAEQFSNECLSSAMLLYDTFQHFLTDRSEKSPTEAVESACQSLEKLLARHLFAPTKAAFITSFNEPKPDNKIARPVATALINYLESLRAQIEQAVEIQETSEPIPTIFHAFFRAIPRLLDMAIKGSSSSASRISIVEKAWIQAVFVALVQSAGCPLEKPKHATSQASLDAVRKLINVLCLHEFHVDVTILRELLWFHSGISSPLIESRGVNWSLFAALLELEPNFLFIQPTSQPSTTAEIPGELISLVFEHITHVRIDECATDGRPPKAFPLPENRPTGKVDSSNFLDLDLVSPYELVVRFVIIPVMAAFARNRNLLDFISRWDLQLSRSPLSRPSLLKNPREIIWQDRRLTLAFAEIFEQSLTRTQITNLFKQYAERVQSRHSGSISQDQESPDYYPIIFSTTFVINTIIESLRDDETIDHLRPQLKACLLDYGVLVRDRHVRSKCDLELFWLTLAELLTILWPIGLQQSKSEQEDLLQPLVEQALKDVSAGRKQKGDECPVGSRSRLGALLFLLTACDHLRTVPGWDEVLQECMRKAFKSISSGRFEPEQQSQVVEILCAEYPQLIEHVQLDMRQKRLSDLLVAIAQIGNQGTNIQIATALSQHIFTEASRPTISAYLAALLSVMDAVDNNDNLVDTAKAALMQAQPMAMSRAQREPVLDKIAEVLLARPDDANVLLSIMNHLMQIPNSTAKISADGNTIIALAQALEAAKVVTFEVSESFHDLVSWTLHHILPNQDQEQNKQFLKKLKANLVSIVKKPRNKCTTIDLAILRAIVAVQKEERLITWNEYMSLLEDCLKTNACPELHVFHALCGLRPTILNEKTDILKKGQEMLRIWTSTRLGTDITRPWQDYDFPSISLPTWVQLHLAFCRFQCYSNFDDLLGASIRLLQQPHSPEERKNILNSVSDALSQVPTTKKIRFASTLLSNENKREAFQILYTLTIQLEDVGTEDLDAKKLQSAFLPRLCDLLHNRLSTADFSAILESIDHVLNHQPWLLSQNSIEIVLATLTSLTSRNSISLPSSDAPGIYARLCHTTRLILKLHRGRLGGRFHLLLPLLQNLLYCLFLPNIGRSTALPPWLKPASTPLTPINAYQYSRLLKTLCSPTLSSVSKSYQRRAGTTKDALNDPIKAAKEYVSQYIYPLLASFCKFQLGGRLDLQVRDKLMQGIWEAIGVANMDRAALDAMFAGLDRASRDIWKSVWGEWNRLHGRAAKAREER